MADTAAKKVEKGKKAKKRKSRGTAGGDNYIVLGKDGNLFVASGKTGGVGALKKKDRLEIESLIRQRQALGLKLTQLLDAQGYAVAPSHPTIIIRPGPDD